MYVLRPLFALDHLSLVYWPISPNDKFKSYLFNIQGVFCCLIFKHLIYFIISIICGLFPVCLLLDYSLAAAEQFIQEELIHDEENLKYLSSKNYSLLCYAE